MNLPQRIMSSGSYTSKLAQILKLKKCAAWEPVWYMYTCRWLIWLWYNRSHNCKTIDYKLKIKKYTLSTSRNKLEYGIQMQPLSFLHFDFQKQLNVLFVCKIVKYVWLAYQVCLSSSLSFIDNHAYVDSWCPLFNILIQPNHVAKK